MSSSQNKDIHFTLLIVKIVSDEFNRSLLIDQTYHFAALLPDIIIGIGPHKSITAGL